MSGARDASLDALRAALTALVLFHHTAIVYGATGGWYYHELAPGPALSSQLLSYFCAVNQSFFMGLFFLIAGYFTPAAVERKGAWRYLRERAIRLGLPLLFFALALSPLTIALAQTAAGRSIPATLAWLWTHRDIENGPLWFAQALLIFSALYLAARAAVPAFFALDGRPPPFPSNGALALAALGVGAAAFALRLVWPIGAQPLGLQLGFFASYVLLFAAGCAWARWPTLDAAPDRQRRLWRIVARIALPLMPVAVILARFVPALRGDIFGGWNAQAAIYALWEPFVAWGLILALLHGFRLRFATLGPWGAALARRAYAVYVIHPPVLVGIAISWREVPAPALLKFAITGAATCAACFALAGLILRASWVRQVL